MLPKLPDNSVLKTIMTIIIVLLMAMVFILLTPSVIDQTHTSVRTENTMVCNFVTDDSVSFAYGGERL